MVDARAPARMQPDVGSRCFRKALFRRQKWVLLLSDVLRTEWLSLVTITQHKSWSRRGDPWETLRTGSSRHPFPVRQPKTSRLAEGTTLIRFSWDYAACPFAYSVTALGWEARLFDNSGGRNPHPGDRRQIRPRPLPVVEQLDVGLVCQIRHD